MQRKHLHRRKRTISFRRRAPPGTSPGTLLVDPKAPPPAIRVISYGPDSCVEEAVTDLGVIPGLLQRAPVTWVNVDGLGDAAAIKRLGEIFGLHRLALEDVVNTHQRPKVEPYGDHLYIVARMIEWKDGLATDQLSLFVGKNFVLSFQEMAGDCFDPIRERIRKSIGRIRKSGPDYLAYALLDSNLDSYFPLLEIVGEKLEEIEDEALSHPGQGTTSRIHALKRDLMFLRRCAWPQREAFNSMLRDTAHFFSDETRIHLRDCYDHSIQIMDLVETYRDLASDLTDIHLSSINNRMNEIMKVLTIMSTLFIPLNFIAGLYGMNFNTGKSPLNMPELNWYWGYPFVLALMGLTSLGMIFFFRRRGWIGSERNQCEEDPHAGDKS